MAPLGPASVNWIDDCWTFLLKLACTGAEKAAWLAQFIATAWEALDRPCSEKAVDTALRYAAERAAAFDPATAVLVHGDAHNLVELAKQETDPEMRKRLVEKLSIMGNNKEVSDYLMQLLEK